MARKKTYKTVAENVQSPAKSVFKSRTQKVADQSDAAIIKAAVKELKDRKEEEILLEAELQKPTTARNKAIVRKYGLENSIGVVDKYPDLSTGDKYDINIHIPEDPSIPLELRPKKWFVTIVIPHKDNKYNFIFPISRANQPGLTYKLDGFDVYLDDDYNVIVDATTKFGLYEALLDYKKGDKENEYNRKAAFKYYGISKGDGSLDFAVRGHNFAVTSTKIKTGDVVTTKKNTSSTPETSTVTNVGKLIVADEVEINGDKATAQKIINDLKSTSSHKLLGLADDQKIYSKELVIKKVFTVSRLGNPIILLEEVNDGKLFAIAINGPTSVKDYLGFNGRSVKLEEIVAKMNRIVYEEYITRKKASSAAK